MDSSCQGIFIDRTMKLRRSFLLCRDFPSDAHLHLTYVVANKNLPCKVKRTVNQMIGLRNRKTDTNILLIIVQREENKQHYTCLRISLNCSLAFFFPLYLLFFLYISNIVSYSISCRSYLVFFYVYKNAKELHIGNVYWFCD